MRLKDYQLDVLEALERYLGVLESEKSDAFEFYDFQQSKGKNPTLADYTAGAWHTGQTQGVVASSLAHKSYYDGLGQPIPSLCLKVPTGGGKTLLATKAVDIIQTRYFKRQTGLVLWIVPSSAIYQQTKAQLSKKSHPYRQMLERASGGRVKFFEKGATLTKQDTENHLCVMLMMLQASNRKTKDVLKMFQDSGGYSDFFPDVDDYAALNAFWQATPNLDRYDLGDDSQPTVNTGLAIKQSLGNTLRLLRPMIVVDEGHKAYSEGARDTLTGFNPSFILELSASSKNDYYLQGWKKSKVFPDFLCWMEMDNDDGAARLLALETKGGHLDGSDTAWKERLFDILQETYESGQELGQLELTDKQAEKMTFKLLMQTQDEKAMLNELEGVFTDG